MAEYLKKKINYALCVFLLFLLFEVPLKHLALKKKTINKPTNNIRACCVSNFFLYKIINTKTKNSRNT